MARLGDYVRIRTGKLDANAASPNGRYPFFTCAVEPLSIDSYSYDCECVLVAGNGDLNVKYYRGRFDAYQRTYIIESKDKQILDTYFLYQFLEKYIEVLRQDSIGGVIKYIKLGNLTEANIPLPDLPTQRRIAATLDKVSEGIDLCRKMLGDLDELVKSQFVEMFGTPESVLDSTHTIAEVADVQVGIVIKPTHYYADGNDGIKAFRSLNIGSMYIKDDDWVYFTEEAMKETQRTVAHTDDVLVVRSGNPGTSCVVPPEYDGCNVIDLIIAHPNKEMILPEYLCAFTNMPHGMNQINSQQRGVAQKHFNVGMYKELRLILPSLDEQKQFVEFLKQTGKSKFAIQRQLAELETLKKSLMQKYFR